MYTNQPDLRPLDKESLVTASIERGDVALATEDFQRATTQFELTSDLGAGEAIVGRLVLVEVVRRTLDDAQGILNKLTSGAEIEADEIAETVENLEEIERKVPDSRAVQVLLPRIQTEASAYRDRLWQEGLALIRGKSVGLTLGQRCRNAEEGTCLLAKAAEVDWEQTPALKDDLANAERRLAYLESARAKASARRKRRLIVLGIVVIGLVGVLAVLAYNSGLVSMPTFVSETTSVAEIGPSATAGAALSQTTAPTDPATGTSMPASEITKAHTPTLAPKTQATRTAISKPKNTATSQPGTTSTSEPGSSTSTTAQSTASATEGTAETASPTRTSSPTPKPSATTRPSTTPSPVPTGSPTVEQAVASPVPTQRPSPTATSTPGIIYPAPVLLEPGDGAYIRQTNVSSLHPLRWEWAGTQKENEWFDIRVWKVGAPHYGIAWTKEKEYLYDSCLQVGGDYNWSIAVIRGEAGEWQGNLSPEATPRWFASGRRDKWCRERGRFMMPPSTDEIE